MSDLDPCAEPYLEETLYRIYEQDGQSGVYEYVKKHYPKWVWGYCDLCDCEAPALPDGYCAVCWGTKVQL